MSHRRGTAALALGAFLLFACDAAGQGILDLFGGDNHARSSRAAASRPPRDNPRKAERKSVEPKAKKREGVKGEKPREDAKLAPSAAEAPPPPYEPQMTRLSETLGALAFLRELCGAGDGDDWRGKMSALVNAEAPSGPRREKLIASFNRGFRGYELAYRVCTPNARTAISRYLDEAARLSLDITYRYGSP